MRMSVRYLAWVDCGLCGAWRNGKNSLYNSNNKSSVQINKAVRCHAASKLFVSWLLLLLLLLLWRWRAPITVCASSVFALYNTTFAEALYIYVSTVGWTTKWWEREHSFGKQGTTREPTNPLTSQQQWEWDYPHIVCVLLLKLLLLLLSGNVRPSFPLWPMYLLVAAHYIV